MDRQLSLVGLEWRRLLYREAPSLAPRRPRPQDPADSLDKQSARAGERGDSFGLVTFALQQDAQCFEHIPLIVR